MRSARPWLLPLVPLYRLGQAIAELRPSPVRKLSRPVISIGNLSTGGTGKTPLTIALAKALTARGLHVDVLSRGYGRMSQAAARVDPNGAAEEFGDEPLVIAREAGVQVYVAAERYEAGLMSEATHPEAVLKGHDFRACPERSRMGAESRSPEQGALAPEGRSSASTPISLHLLDDGFQHRRLARNVDILLLNRQDWTGTLLPAGNLREPLKAARRASVIAISTEDAELESELRRWGWQGAVWRLRRHMEVPRIEGPVAAFCGIARSDQFFAGLEAAGLHIASRTAFRDHHRYAAHDVDCLLDAARNVQAAAFLTTKKDRARLDKLREALTAKLKLEVADLLIEIEDEAGAIDWLIDRCSTATP